MKQTCKSSPSLLSCTPYCLSVLSTRAVKFSTCTVGVIAINPLSLFLSVFYLAQHKNRFYLEPYDTYSNCLNCIRAFKSVLALKSIMQQKFITKHYEQQYFLNELLFLKVNNNPKMWKLNNNSCINIGMLDFL